jgi:hypothetical protein
MRAMTFERLVHEDRFVSELLTTTIGALHLERPPVVHRADAHVDVADTALELQHAHRRAVAHSEATIITSLAIPFVGMEAELDATPVKPDFAVVAARRSESDPQVVEGSWLIVGDAKDYERVRSRIDDQRMLKGYLQVALGAESAAEWSQLPDGMRVHSWGALAVPRNAFLQPEAVVECLDDHRQEVRLRAEERMALLGGLKGGTISDEQLPRFTKKAAADFDPQRCVSCSLFNLCREELRKTRKKTALLVELGVPAEYHAALEAYLRTGTTPLAVPESVLARVRATDTGRQQWTRQHRIDPVGESGTVEVALVKADSAALGVHGISLRRVRIDGSHTEWKHEVFADPQSLKTRMQVMKLLAKTRYERFKAAS